MSNFTCNQEKPEISFCTQNIGHNFKAWQTNVLVKQKFLNTAHERVNASNLLWEQFDII